MKIGWSSISFNPRPHTAGDCPTRYSFSRLIRVSIHARTRRATAMYQLATAIATGFNPRPHTAGDVGKTAALSVVVLFQSTPAHGGRLFLAHTWPETKRVSIHARTRRATEPVGDFGSGLHVSIHARTRRATMLASLILLNLKSFNPRPHTAGDRHSICIN